METPSNRRREARVKTAFETLYSAERVEGAGVLSDISYQGALLNEASGKPAVGAHVRLYVFVRPVAPFELVGSVVRHTTNGFAIQFEKLDAETKSLVDDVAAIVTVPQVQGQRDRK